MTGKPKTLLGLACVSRTAIMQGTNRSFVAATKITLDLVVSSTPNWSRACKHTFGRHAEIWSHRFVSPTTTSALCHLSGSCCVLASFLVPLLSVGFFLLSIHTSLYCISCAACSLSATGFVLLHSFLSKDIVFTLFTAFQLPLYRVESVSIILYPLTAI